MKTEIVIDLIGVCEWYIIGGLLGVSLCYFVKSLAILLKITKGKFKLESIKYTILMFTLSWLTVFAYLCDIVINIIDPLLYRKYKNKYWYWVFKSVIIEHVFYRKYIMEKYFDELYWEKHRYCCVEINDNNKRYRKYKKIKDRFFKRYYRRAVC